MTVGRGFNVFTVIKYFCWLGYIFSYWRIRGISVGWSSVSVYRRVRYRFMRNSIVFRCGVAHERPAWLCVGWRARKFTADKRASTQITVVQFITRLCDDYLRFRCWKEKRINQLTSTRTVRESRRPTAAPCA